MTRWLVILSGDVADLDRLVEWKDGDDWQIVHHENHGAVLCGARFEALDDNGSVRRAGEDLIKLLSLAARFRTDFQDVTIGATVEQGQGGNHIALHAHDMVHVHLAEEITVRAYASLDAMIANQPLPPSKPPPGPDCARLVRLLEIHPDLADAIRYLEKEPDLRGYYKVGEAILRVLGKPKKWCAFDKLGWASNIEVQRFTRSTHMSRHHGVRGPDNPMSDREACAFVEGLLGKLIEHVDCLS